MAEVVHEHISSALFFMAAWSRNSLTMFDRCCRYIFWWCFEARSLTAALHAACSEGHRKLVPSLCRAKANVKHGSREGSLHFLLPSKRLQC